MLISSSLKWQNDPGAQEDKKYEESFYEIASFGSHADRFFPGGVGFWLLGRSPRFAATAVANTLTVATPPIFIRGGELEKVMGHSYENAVLGGGSRSVATFMAAGGLSFYRENRSYLNRDIPLTPLKGGIGHIFIRGGELEKVMGHSYENAVLGGGSRSVATLMAETSNIFIRGGELGKVMQHFHDQLLGLEQREW